MEFFVYGLDAEHSENAYVSSTPENRVQPAGKRPARVHFKDEDGQEFVMQVGQLIKSLRVTSDKHQRRIWESRDPAVVVTLVPDGGISVLTNAVSDAQVRKLSDWESTFSIPQDRIIRTWSFEELETENAAMPA